MPTYVSVGVKMFLRLMKVGAVRQLHLTLMHSKAASTKIPAVTDKSKKIPNLSASVSSPVSVPSRTVHLKHPIKNMSMIDLLALVPNATGEVEFVENNAWVLRNLKKGKIDVPAGPLVSFTLEEGINLGNTFSLTNKFGFDASSPPVLTMRGVELLGGVISPGTPTGHWCEILVTNIDTGEKGKYVALAGTGASLTALPAVAERLGVEAGGHTNTLTAMGMKRSMCGAVQVQLLRIAYPQGLDRTTGVQIHSYKELSEDVRASIKQTNPVVATQMESEVPLIGLNLLGAWGLAVDPHLGVVPSQNKP